MTENLVGLGSGPGLMALPDLGLELPGGGTPHCRALSQDSRAYTGGIPPGQGRDLSSPRGLPFPSLARHLSLASGLAAA